MLRLSGCIVARAVPKRANNQLWGGAKIIYGEKSSDDKKSPKKSLKVSKPNVHAKKVTSELLDTTMKIKMTTRVMRSIDKAGGFDNYILKNKHKDSALGRRLKQQMEDVLAQQPQPQ